MRVANAPLSYGAFEVTVGVYPNVPGPDELLAEMAAAGYEGTELGPPGYLGEGDELRARLDAHGLALTGGWCPLRFSEPEHVDEASKDSPGRSTSSRLQARATRVRSSATAARRTRREPGGPSLNERGWAHWHDGIARAAELARGRGFEPTCTRTRRRSASRERRSSVHELTDVGLLVDTGHYLLGGPT